MKRKMVATVDLASDPTKHAGEINAVVYDYDHVYSGGNDGVINVSFCEIKKKILLSANENFFFFILGVG